MPEVPARRGRPYLPAAAATVTSRARGRRQLIGWLLRANRLLGHDHDRLDTRRFATAFAGSSHPAAVSPSTISRWETNQLRAPYRAVHRYEEVLELPAGQLISTIDIVDRYWTMSMTPAPRLARSDAEDDHVQRLLDKAASAAIMTGAEWDDLTVQLSAFPQPLAPRRVWDDVAGRLLAEMIISSNVAWNQRFEAFNRLLTHPAIQCSAIAACADLAADRSNLVFIETISALDATSHPDANRHVLAQLRAPTNDRALVGALLACIRKLQRHHFAPSQTRQIAAATVDLLNHDRVAGQACGLAREVLRQSSPNQYDAPTDALAHRLHANGRSGTLADSAQVPESIMPMVARIVGATTSGLHDISGFHDETLTVLVQDMLFQPVLDVRLYAAMLIRATPYRQPVAEALTAELTRALADRRIELVEVLIDALRTVGGPAQRPILERLTLLPSVPVALSRAAAFAVGHVPSDTLSDNYWIQALWRHTNSWRHHSTSENASVLTGLVYSMGIARQIELLTSIQRDRRLPPAARSAASWWLSLPDFIYFSAASDPNS